MSVQKPASWIYTEEFLAEPPALEAARRRGEELGATPVLPGTGAALRLLAASVQAHTVVEIGTGAGVSALWLLDGMPEDGVLTTIDIEAQHHRAARQSFSTAGIAPQRTRIITGQALDVLPRLADGAYDMVVVDGDAREYPAYVEQALRVVRVGGVVALDDMLWHDRVADPAARDETTTMLRTLGKQLRDDERLQTSLLPVGDGLLVAVRKS
ncbi:O-methyltransferase [Mobilicoccus pelagius]|uniref:Putative methyltransferase n=1 Tax=Mobilicoccus pelagius NBRC 104925 TaxID=1089455 RepID=H5URN1_9MICO|nr:O-methyltransferase [Mobilicoccus pelagius]GAB48389.1 putative methyltransferase [Mobilicoccus pelagius NBRC 104925]